VLCLIISISAIPLSHSYFSILYPLTGYVLSLSGMNDYMAMQLVSMLALVASFFYLRKAFAAGLSY
jgi:hypothetical protein